jgi:ADP-ribosylglycohydrolase
MSFPADYLHRVYAGVLGKIIGVYLGRPFEGWTHERILRELGPIESYVHERLNQPLIVTDDDISGTFTFVRAMEDYGFSPRLSARQIGQAWLNYIVENRTILWWGGMGTSTEHTAFLRLKKGIDAPRSGSIALNGPVVAEQIGAQIFIDGWGMICPGDPKLAATLAREAASVSHDGEAIHGAVVVAVIESLAFVERDIARLIESAIAHIPADSTIAKMNRYLLDLRSREPDWHAARAQFARIYNYENYPGGCHMVPNHGVIMLALLWGDGDFSRSLMIANTCGWDTDCNSGNVGCILGLRNGLDGIDPKWRTPVADRMYLPTAEGGSCVTDAAREAVYLANVARQMRGLSPIELKGGARYHFALPGSVQGFTSESGDVEIRNDGGFLRIDNRTGGRRPITTRTLPPLEMLSTGYSAAASPTLYAGQTMRAWVRRLEGEPRARPIVRIGGADDVPETLGGQWASLASDAQELVWKVQTPPGAVIAEAGIEIDGRAVVALDSLTWDGEPECVFGKPAAGGSMWKHAWVSSLYSVWHDVNGMSYLLIQNDGRGLLSTGTRQWRDYRVEAEVMPHMVRAFGLAARYQGQRRYYALLLTPTGLARLLKLHDEEQVLAEKPLDWSWRTTYRLALRVHGNRIEAFIDGQKLFDIKDPYQPLECGGIAMLVEEGQTQVKEVSVGA